jgi:hypothetical protein
MFPMRALHCQERFTVLKKNTHLLLPSLVSAECAARFAAAVLAAKEEWTADFKGSQFSLGRAWYTHLETGKERQYFRDAAKADALVERTLPGMQAALRSVLAELVGMPVVPRPGFCGAGVHIFPPQAQVSVRGGCIHADLEGLRTASERASPALTLVLMLQPPRTGGGLLLWDSRYMEGHEVDSSSVPTSLAYRAGDAVVIESQRIHQIEAFSGDTPRISITLHALNAGERWLSWF